MPCFVSSFWIRQYLNLLSVAIFLRFYTALRLGFWFAINKQDYIYPSYKYNLFI